MPLAEHSYHLGQLSFQVEGTHPEVFAYLDRVFGAFAGRSLGDSTGKCRVTDFHGRLVVSMEGLPDHVFESTSHATEHLIWQMTQSALKFVGDDFALHAAGLARMEGPGSGAILLIGPSGSGKSTLTLELLQRGFGFLSDEAVFLSFHSATVRGFPRAIGILDCPHGPSGSPRKRYVSPRALPAPIVSNSMPVESVVLLNGFARHSRTSRVTASVSLPRLLSQVYAPGPADGILDALVRLILTTPVVELQAGRPDEAADLIAHLSRRVVAA